MDNNFSQRTMSTNQTYTQISNFGKIIIWLFVIWVSIQYGAGLYEKRIIIPLWLEATPDQLTAVLEASGQKDSALKFWVFVSPLVALLALINLIFALRSKVSIRNWWLAASLLMLLNSIFTYTYFVPAMIKLWDASNLEPGWVSTSKIRWVNFNYIRLVIGTMGWICLLKTFSQLGRDEK
jgi:hypothetical protein